MDKKRILIVNEASFLNTGFSTIGMELISRLYNSGKYELAELGCYNKPDDPKIIDVPWKFYSSMPDIKNTEAINAYNSNVHAQFGSLVFERVCLDFRPDIVFSLRDYWMDSEWIEKSPFRKYFKFIHCPTVDGKPQQPFWLQDYAKCDSLLTYSEFGKETFENEHPSLKVDGILRPAVNVDVCKPLGNKLKLRNQYGLPLDGNIILMLARNQARKLYPDLFEGFVKFLNKCEKEGKHELANNTNLLIHSSYPDVGFNFAHHLIWNHIAHKVYFTYVCENCGYFYASKFQSEVAVCPKCAKPASHMPNSSFGVSRKQIAEVHNMADLYVQLATAEGLCMPVAEARACGVPAMVLNYSALQDVAREQPELAINVQRRFWEPEIQTGQARALPDLDHFADKLMWFFELEDKEKKRLGSEARRFAEEKYSFDHTADVLSESFNKMSVYDQKKTWLNPKPRIRKIPQQIADLSSNTEFVNWCIENVLQDPSLVNTYWSYSLVKAVNVGYRIDKGGRIPFNRNKLVKLFVDMVREANQWESARVEHLAPESNKPKWKVV